MSHARAYATSLTLAGLLVAACSSSDSTTTNGGTPATTGACAADTRKDVYAAGLTKQSTDLSVKIVDASPSPPSKGTNSLTLQILDAAGNPIDGATVNVTPFMPDHGHGSAVTPLVTPMANGKYDVSKVYLPMAGLWKITVTVEAKSAATEDVAFSFCLDG